MKILMLGHSGVGKTTYVASMYGTMQIPVSGFSISATRSEDNDRLMMLHENIRRGRYPAPSNHRESYPFRLRYGGADVLSFDWTDYRGGALVESSKESDDARSLHSDLKAADAVLAFFDCTMLETRGGHFPEIRRMILLLSKAMQEVDHKMPLALVMAKADLISNGSRLFEPLQNLFETVSVSKHVVGSVIPVACGRESQNVGLPALFALYFGLSNQMHRLGERINALAAERDSLNAKVSTLGGFFSDLIYSKWNGFPTDGEIAERKHSELLREYSSFQSLERPLEALGEYLDGNDEFGVFGGGWAKEAGA